MATSAKFPFKHDNSITTRFAKYNGKPNPTRNKRAEVKKANPFHYSLGEVRPVWKTWQSYATNMGILENEDEKA